MSTQTDDARCSSECLNENSEVPPRSTEECVEILKTEVSFLKMKFGAPPCAYICLKKTTLFYGSE